MNVLLIINDEIACYGLKAYLEKKEDNIIINTCRSMDELKRLLSIKSYDLFVISINLKEFSISHKKQIHSGFYIAHYIKGVGCDNRILMTCYYNRRIYEVKADDLCIEGLVNESISTDEFYYTMRYVVRGKRCINKVIIDDRGGYRLEGKKEILLELLSNREIEVLSEILKGKSIKETANILFVSERTVSNHLNHIYFKLEVKSRQEAIYKAIQLGYFPYVLD
ncbi:MAG TPA: response regulator transcription factor [Epulopiscium sp.]|nr:response regulator transcription factor [Candidatus Epulonipiscium sp.]